MPYLLIKVADGGVGPLRITRSRSTTWCCFPSRCAPRLGACAVADHRLHRLHRHRGRRAVRPVQCGAPVQFHGGLLIAAVPIIGADPGPADQSPGPPDGDALDQADHQIQQSGPTGQPRYRRGSACRSSSPVTTLGYAIGPIIANRRFGDVRHGGRRRVPGDDGPGLHAQPPRPGPNDSLRAVVLAWVAVSGPSARRRRSSCTSGSWPGAARATVIAYVEPAVAVARRHRGQPLTASIVGSFFILAARSSRRVPTRSQPASTPAAARTAGGPSARRSPDGARDRWCSAVRGLRAPSYHRRRPRARR